MHRSMMQVFVKNSIEAVVLYQKAFHAEIVCDGGLEHTELDVFGQILAISEASHAETITGNTMLFCLHFGKGKEELVRSIVGTLSEGGALAFHGPVDWSPYMADITDRFGVHWCIFV